MTTAKVRVGDAAPGLVNRQQVQALLEQLGDPGQLEGNEIAQRLIMVFRTIYRETLGDAALTPQRILVLGLSRLWREKAFNVSIFYAARKQLAKFFTLEVWYLYPLRHGAHCLELGDDWLVGPPPSAAEVAFRLSLPDYLALILADGDKERAKMHLQEHERVLKAIGQKIKDKAPGPQPENTVRSRRDAGLELLAVALDELLRQFANAPAVGPEVSLEATPMPVPGVVVAAKTSGTSEAIQHIAPDASVEMATPDSDVATDALCEGDRTPSNPEPQAGPGPVRVPPGSSELIEPANGADGMVSDPEPQADTNPAVALPGSGAQMVVANEEKRLSSGPELQSDSSVVMTSAESREPMDAVTEGGISPRAPEPETVSEMALPKGVKSIDVASDEAGSPSSPQPQAAALEATSARPVTPPNLLQMLEQIESIADPDDRWVLSGVAQLVEQTLSSATAGHSLPLLRERAHWLAQHLAAIAFGLEESVLPTRRLSYLNVRAAYRRMGLESDREGDAILEFLVGAGILWRRDDDWVFVHPLLTELFAGSFIADQSYERLLWFATRPRVMRWAAHAVARKSDDVLNHRLCMGLYHSLQHLHPVSRLDAAAVISEFYPGLVTPAIAQFGRWLTPLLRELGPIPSGQLQQALQKVAQSLNTDVPALALEPEYVIPSEAFEAVQRTMDAKSFIELLGVSEQRTGREGRYEDRRVGLAAIQHLANGATWDSGMQCATWVRQSPLDWPLDTGWRSFLPGQSVHAIDLLAELSLSQEATEQARILARSALATERHMTMLLNRGRKEHEALIHTLLMATGLRYTWDDSAEKWKPLRNISG